MNTENIERKTPSQVWAEIEGKAHLYKTAYMGEDCVGITGIVCKGTFEIAHPVWGRMHVGCHELTDYGL